MRRAQGGSFIPPAGAPAGPAATPPKKAPAAALVGPANVTDTKLVAANHAKPGPATAAPTAPASGGSNLPGFLSGSGNMFGGSGDIMSMLMELLGGGAGNKQAAAPVDPNQSELFRQQAEQVKLNNDAMRAQSQGRIDRANLVNARNRLPGSNIGSLTYTGSPAQSIDNQIFDLNRNGGYSTGWYGSMWPRT